MSGKSIASSDTTQLFSTPFHRAYWKLAAREFTSLHVLILAAMMTALRIAIKSVRIPIGPDLNITFGFLFNAVGSMIYGPLVAIAASAVSDTVGAILFPSGAYFFPYIFSEIAGGLLFALFYRVDSGVLGLGSLLSWELPRALYTCRVLTPFGFPYPGFRSSDYFALLPWLFLFFAGFYLFRILEPLPGWRKLARVKIPLLSAVGRHTMWVYLLHQPLLMGLCMILFKGEI